MHSAIPIDIIVPFRWNFVDCGSLGFSFSLPVHWDMSAANLGLAELLALKAGK